MDSSDLPRCRHLHRGHSEHRKCFKSPHKNRGWWQGPPTWDDIPQRLIKPALGTTLQCVALSWQNVLETGPRITTTTTMTASHIEWLYTCMHVFKSSSFHGYLWEGFGWERAMRTFWGVGNVLVLGRKAGIPDVYKHKHSPSCAPRLCKLCSCVSWG